MGRHDHDGDDDDDGSSSSSSSSLDDIVDNNNNDDDRRERKRSSKKQHKKRRKRDENSSSKKKRKKHRSRREHSDDSEASSDDDTDDKDESDGQRKKKRRKKDKKRRKDTHRSSREKKSNKKQRRESNKSKSSRRRNNDDDNDGDNDSRHAFSRNHALANALLQLLDSHPALVSDLPIMLIRLAGGTTFDLSQMTDPTAAQGIAAVFKSLESYGVQQQQDSTTPTGGAWMWKGPQQQQVGSSNSNNNNKNDLVLVRVVRTLLDQIGITIDAVEAFESDELKRRQEALRVPTTTQNKLATTATTAASSTLAGSCQKDDPIIGQVKQMFINFDKNEGLGKELAVLCNMILDGESIALDGLPDERLRKALECLFETCGLEKCEMENDDDDEDDDSDEEQATDANGEQEKETPSMGYGLPENHNGNAKETTARVRLEAILTACQQQTQTQSTSLSSDRRRVLGPSLPPAGFEQEEESDEEGPQLTADANARPESADMVRAQAARRARELRAVNAGLSVKDVAAIEAAGGREEWMIVPGQYDFLDCIKSAPIRSRTFQGGSKHDKDKQRAEGPIDPAVQTELNAILQAHEESRGPSLFEEHRAAKAAAEAEKNKSGKNHWKWNRDRDLDEGRRVDKDALNMVMGGAASGLQSKFQGGFGR